MQHFAQLWPTPICMAHLVLYPGNWPGMASTCTTILEARVGP